MPPPPFDKASKTALEWHLHFAIAEALADSREAPWYAAWNIVLKDFLFESSFCHLPLLTVTYPQYPVSKNIDTHHPEDDIHDDDDSDDEDDEDDDGGGDDWMAQSLSSPYRPTMGRYSAPSPESHRSSSSPQAHRGPSSPTPARYSAPSPESPQVYRGPPSHRRKKRSTRIPDFAQLVYRLCVNPDRTIDRPVLIQNRIILLVENKANIETPTLMDFLPIMRQTDQQARRAFALFPNVDTLGVILAIGPYWTYIEYDSANTRPSPSQSEQNDPTYMETTPPATEAPGRYYEPLVSLFNPHGFARLETDLSAEGLKLVRHRMKLLAGVQ